MMAKLKGPTFETPESEKERRPLEVYDEDVEPPSSRVVFFACPFCDTSVKAYVWSLAGGGKRCGCGAMFSYYGGAMHWADLAKRPGVAQ